MDLTATQKEQTLIVQDALNVLSPRLNNLIEQAFPAFKESLLDADAPRMPEGSMKEMPDATVEID